MGDVDARAVSARHRGASGVSSRSYDRAPSPQLRQLLAPGGYLAPLRAERTLGGIDLEVHLRRLDEVHVYCGLTRLVTSGPGTGGKVWVKTHKTYATQSCARLLIRPGRAMKVDGGNYHRDEWAVGEPGFAQALDVFLGGVRVDERQRKEGAIQATWAQIRNPWVAFDKEAVLGYPSEKERTRQLLEAFDPAVDEAREHLCALAEARRLLPSRRDHWAMPPLQKTRLELDQLAVDSTGKLVLLEIKEASAAAQTVYYAPFQLLQNVWEWHRALNTVRSSVQELLDARTGLGLSPPDVSPITGTLRAVIAFGEDSRSTEVKRRYCEVLGIANRFLPADVPPIETWCLKGGKPVQVP